MKYVYLCMAFTDETNIKGMAEHIIDVFGEHTGEEGFTWEGSVELMSKEEAIAFAKKYLEVRKRRGTNEINLDDEYWIWKIATEYILLDIIPFIYREALD